MREEGAVLLMLLNVTQADKSDRQEDMWRECGECGLLHHDLNGRERG